MLNPSFTLWYLQTKRSLCGSTEAEATHFVPKAQKASTKFTNVKQARTMRLHIAAVFALFVIHRITAQGNEGLPDATPRIVGGLPAKSNAYPYFVTTVFTADSLCGASLIHEDFVMTAGHCFGAFNAGVRIGVENTSNEKEGITRQVVEQFLHPDYTDSSAAASSDIMLLKLNKGGTGIRPVRYVRSKVFPRAGDELTVMGFGDTEGGVFSDQLLQVSVNAVTNSVCQDEYGGDFAQAVMFCAGVTEGGKDSCQGDSGMCRAITENASCVVFAALVLALTYHGTC
jgi:trypsin